LRIFDEDGTELDYKAIVGLDVNCFMCTNQLKDTGGILLSPPSKTYSDNVSKIDKMHLCKNCFGNVMNFIMGKTNGVEVSPKLHMIDLSLVNATMQPDYDKVRKHIVTAREQIKNLLSLLLTGEIKVSQLR